MISHQAKYIAHDLTLQHGGGGIERLSQALFNASVDLNPHQIDAAVFALSSPLSKGALLADEVGLGKTIEAGIVLCQYWAERKRQLLVICPASLRKQWALELEEKFNLPAIVLDSKTWRETQRKGIAPLNQKAVIIVSFAYATKIKEEIRSKAWDLVIMDEAHKLRNAYRESNKIGQALKWATEDSRKLLLTATPLQNSVLELYGLSTLIDENIFGDLNAFKSQYTGSGANMSELRNRLASFCKRTLRKDVTEYISYTKRKPLTQKFRSTDDEHSLYEAVTTYLEREDSYAIPKRQRHLTELILRKLLASSSQAIAGTLGVMQTRLKGLLDEKVQEQDDWLDDLVSEEDVEQDLLDEILEPFDETDQSPIDTANLDRKKLIEEIADLEQLITWASGIGTDTKTTALLQALNVGFKAMTEMSNGGAARKALVFTESRRTQQYLKNYLELNGHAGKVILFSGTNNSPEATQIYKNWLNNNQGSGRISGSKDIDIRTAIIEYFRDHADILIATEAAAEGVNMQFCSLVINYDLPWNPQRVEQRIGRCHRYGQKHDVVVINFFNERNHADKRVLELLEDKFKLFDGVFGASDEVLGSIESGVDFEKRILKIVKTCRTTKEIDHAFNALRAELEASIQERMKSTHQQLLATFDADVHDRLKLQLQDTHAQLDKFSRKFWELSQFILEENAGFNTEQHTFDLTRSPNAQIKVGKYYLISKQSPAAINSENKAISTSAGFSGEGFTYRLSHPLGEWVIQQAKALNTPVEKIIFDTQKNQTKITVVENLKGKSGVLTLQKLSIDSFEKQEYLLFSGMTDENESLDQETCEKLMNCFATVKDEQINLSEAVSKHLQAQADRHTQATVAQSLENNNQHFAQARDRLERWADDMISGAEQALKNTREQIKVANREARLATTLEEQRNLQDRIAKLEKQLRTKRREIFEVEDEIHAKRDELIAQLTKRMTQKLETQFLFTLTWTVQ